MNNDRITFGNIIPVIDIPDLLGVQKESFFDFLQMDIAPAQRENKGLQQVFTGNFPILDNPDTSRAKYRLDFDEYYIERPRYSLQECREKGLTYSASIKARMTLSSKDPDTNEWVNSVQQTVYLGTLPYMTEQATFVINGAERVVVSQLHRSPGVAFAQTIHPNGTPLYSARIIPLKGSWVEFTTDINYVLNVYIDRRKKFPSTTLLRALGYETDDEILSIFGIYETVDLNDIELETLLSRKVATEVFNTNTGEIFLNRNDIIDEEALAMIKEAGVESINLIRTDLNLDQNLILNTIEKDTTHSKEEALLAIYRQLRTGEAPDVETAEALLEKTFFNDKRYDLGEVGRHRMNDKLELGGIIPDDLRVLDTRDFIEIMKYIILMKEENAASDDIDHLGNRRVRTVGEQLQQQFNTGLARMARTIKDRMSIRDAEGFAPQDLVNARTISSVITSFFGTNQLSQFMDQTNPLSELTHKRRMSALGPGGLTRERAGFEVRDVHYTHYGRLCPIETPEGPNIGLISSLTIFSRVNKFGFLETPYRVVKDSVVTDEVVYLTAEQEDMYTIAQANAEIDGEGRFIRERVKCRRKGDFPIVHPEEVEFMDVAPEQIVSAAAALIPFLEHDDANRALMGSNMQRQAVPLIKPEAPIVGTGLEGRVARDTRSVIVAEEDGEVIYVDSDKIVVDYNIDPLSFEALTEFDEVKTVTYKLVKFSGTNQETSITQRPIVKLGQKVKKGDVLADGFATDQGELALGRNILVAFMPWRGYNFEDAIILSEKLVKNDVFSSIHIEEFELQVRETKRGDEELTREIPNVSEETVKNLDENGIIRIGAEVKESDILIGKLTPKGESDPTPEEKLLRAIFGDKAGEVKDASLRATPGLRGTVIKTRLFSRRRKDPESKRLEKKLNEELDATNARNKVELRKKMIERLAKICAGKKTLGVKDEHGIEVIKAGTKITEETLEGIEVIEKLDEKLPWFEDARANEFVQALMKNYLRKLADLDEDYKREKQKILIGDELPPGIIQLAKVYVAKKRKVSVGDKMAGRHGNKGVVAKIVPEEDMPFLPDGTRVEMILNPLGVPSRMNLGQLYETALGWVGKELGLRFATPVFDGAEVKDVNEYLEKANLPAGCKIQLYDGRTGSAFDQKVTCGYIYMLKLSHLVDDKLHARSIGPYSLITQQPLGGKAQFGGQRFGEMEVWALEAYGASHILQEILTVKSDDVAGRTKVYESIVKGENIQEPNVPEAFNVLIKELQGLGLDVEIE
ncbi:MAG: DNA-directed RNA polymerase subunit beta [Ignavibacteriales bacterium]|mgnify:CR=1 FL=1|nr:MAG: DNA-directed RNA polymerase subunit beta [Ignavibacteriaceae bacterium]MBW7873050.1 DNA-directed RNA polymerase subunit beta [Ignavibacteria bacterium]MCZ2142693.1 DNA-directed RNA polymerase subunit beta [Ignavibacteriales bacterium]MBV6443789.1 DNA-directed RNA polymerase subunit beta [Ignavibacteriaceae bacterium]MBZ0196370.1 DNA-directed RNA polymerase subunit beta [Ignavibacteriaceae bacterium]